MQWPSHTLLQGGRADAKLANSRLSQMLRKSTVLVYPGDRSYTPGVNPYLCCSCWRAVFFYCGGGAKAFLPSEGDAPPPQ